MTNSSESPPERPTASQIEDLRLAASRLSGPARRAFQAEMALKYCEGNPRRAERLFGWGRQTVALGLAEKHHQIICVGSQSGFAGNKRWEERYPDAAAALVTLAEAHSQQDPSFKTSIAYTRLTAREVRQQLQAQGFAEEQLPARSTVAVILNRLGYRLRPVVKAKPQKNSLKLT
ncbi:MAG: transposase [Cyanobacteria bacterium J06636_16]